MGPMGLMRPMGLIGFMGLMGLMGPMETMAQTPPPIIIGGNVYGGGNHGDVKGSTKVDVQKGDIDGVFGGARQANVKGHTFVNIDGEHAIGNILIRNVYGGNDISGHIGTPDSVDQDMPKELTEVLGNGETKETHPEKNAIDNSWNTYVRVSRSKKEVAGNIVENWPIIIGSLFSGGNGDFTYLDENGDSLRDDKGNYIVKEGDIVVGSSKTPMNTPDINKAYLEMLGGDIAHVYGGGNNATVNENTTLCIANESSDLETLVDQYVEETDSTREQVYGYFLSKVKLNTFQSETTALTYNAARIFGGNNKATMAIRPTWNLRAGKVRDLYSGGNQGDMTSPEGLLLEIPSYSDITVTNVYGGCRMANVMPTINGKYTPCSNLPGYNFPDELSARVLISGGNITNVYGGNDITGNVYGGNAIGIYKSIAGDVYGGGNGAYAYTDNSALKDDDICSDFYYSTEGFTNSIDALNAHRPNAEQVSIRLKGSAADNPTIIKGRVFLGGNSASLDTKKKNPMVVLKMGDYVICENIFLGNNGEKMTDPKILELYAKQVNSRGETVDSDGSDYSSLSLNSESEFANYMEGVTMKLLPNIMFDNIDNGDPDTYTPGSSYVGSFFCGGNVGSMAVPGLETFSVSQELNIYNKFVGGCNNANIAAGTYNAAYEGGLLGSQDERTSYTDNEGNIKDRLQLNLDNLTIVPLRWKEDGTQLVWNTNKWDSVKKDFAPVDRNPGDKDIRLLNGNIYGGCYSSGHVNGNVVININEDVIKKEHLFGSGIYGRPSSGVDSVAQRNDVMAIALTVFGAGYGKDTEIWGSSTVNLNNGYAMQIFGGGEQGVVGKKTAVYDSEGRIIDHVYEYNPAYSTYVNLNGAVPVYSNTDMVENLAEADYLYGAGNMGDVCGNSYVNLGNGRIYDAFGGASDADILGHTEVYVGRQPKGDGNYKDGFPWVKDVVYGGNDFGGTIHGAYEDGYDFTKRIENYDSKKTKLHGYAEGRIPDVLKSAAYVEYLMGRVDTIFGGGYGSYDYADEMYEDEEGNAPTLPYQESAFVNIRPKANAQNHIIGVFGAGTGYPLNRKGDKSQDRSYVLIDIPDDDVSFKKMSAFGAGSYNGLGMNYSYAQSTAPGFNQDKASAIVDLLRGQMNNVYGGGYNEGVTRRTVVNVPKGSTIKVNNIYGGSYGSQILPPCDVYDTYVNYASGDASVSGAIYGGNNFQRRSLYTHVNISAPVWQVKEKGYTGTIYGAGRGFNTWSEYTEVNMLDGAEAYNVYGGGEQGHVLNSESVERYMRHYASNVSPHISAEDPDWADNYTGETEAEKWQKAWTNAWAIGEEGDGYYWPTEDFDNYMTNAPTNLDRIAARAELDDKTTAQLDGMKKHNTNVIIHQGATVGGYAYGGGLGSGDMPTSGDVYGSTYIAVLGGTVKKDVYAGGRAGGLDNLFESDEIETTFQAKANAYIQGGTVRNVYGGGYLGHVGHHVGNITDAYSGDRLADSYVVIGNASGSTFENGVPAILRNVYGGGEGGSVYGATHITLNKGYIGYRYKNTGSEDKPIYKYVEELDDQKPGDLDLSGNIFGGGYVINSYVDETHINMYGGTVRGSLYGGGEVGPIGRGTMKTGITPEGALTNNDATIVKAGKTHVNMYNGHVKRNVFGGGRGKDSWGGDGTMYMDPAVVAQLDMKCKGYIFGQTDVNIHGGEIGTEEGMALGYGNVFGGCDEGSVYSAYNQNGKLFVGNSSGERYDDNEEGYYYRYNGTKYVDETGTALEGSGEKYLTEDCHVLVEPWLQVTTPFSNKEAGDYVDAAFLNTLGKKNKESGIWPAEWSYLDTGDSSHERGVVIHNAVFGGGNISVGGEIYANTKTVFGNVSASIHDIYNRDLVTIGTGHTGGLYGDGNLTLVDGYRELNITNYGTDFYNIKEEITLSAYEQLPRREQAYYELKYMCRKECTDKEGTIYTPGSTLPQDELLVLFEGDDTVMGVDGKPKEEYWTENGVVSRYAGRIMNTIQRADFCGIFGSRMVMRGAKDRVPEVEDNTNYTVNRVREVSLNKKAYGPGGLGEYDTHGNYFGIYSVVNYLGALTSDVDFHDAIRYTDNNDATKYKCAADDKAYGTATYADWKKEFHKDPRRNNGLSHNQVALASGVYLELTTEKLTGKTLDTKDWGLITGVVELDLINVAKGVGGGFVYAKNVHGVRQPSGKTHTLLTDLNKTGGIGDTAAVTNKSWKYIETDSLATSTQEEWQTSGNFVHNTQVIIDDCYNISNRYKLSNRVPAHYWYIRGTVYVYDQYITAHTGSANAYSKEVEIPITITAAMNNRMHLMDVQPNRYAYYSNYTSTSRTVLGEEQKLMINDVEYRLNDPISYWDWSQLPARERNLFVEKTYVTTGKSKIGNTIYPDGYVMLPDEYKNLLNATSKQDVTPDDNIYNPVPAVLKVVTDDEGNDVVATDHEGHNIYVAFDDVFHSSNNMSHGNGYMLTYKMTNPSRWDTWYTPKTGDAATEKKQSEDANFENGPTYRLKDDISATVLGQREYAVGSIIAEDVYARHETLKTEHSSALPDGQATFRRAYVVTNEYSSETRHLYPGAPISAAVATEIGSSFAKEAYVCTATIQLSPTEYIFVNDLLTSTDIESYKSAYPAYKDEIDELVVPAYYCDSVGLYGGNYYEAGKNYRGLAAWSSMQESDRQKFTFNYDALDLLIDTLFSKNIEGTIVHQEGQKYQYDSQEPTLDAARANKATYSLPTPIDYTATYDGTSALNVSDTVRVKRNKTNLDVTTIQKGDILESTVFETLLNEQSNYAPIAVAEAGTFYVANKAFFLGEPFAAGQVIDKATYDALPTTERSENVDVLTFNTPGTYYYCRQPYTIATTAKGGKPVKAYMTNGSIKADTTIAVGNKVPAGFIISQDGDGVGLSYQYGYRSLTNQQTGFIISGESPMETSTLYVSNDANINDLSTEKIITVIYQYDYEESDESGLNITPISERHVVNIHIRFESGVPTVDDIREPDIVLPGTSITMRVPTVTPGSYEIIGGGWQLFEKETDAESHTNGMEYVPSADPLYWYQDDFYLAYYARTYLGKTYSNAVPVHVANYHDLKRVMDDKENHLHVDYDRNRLKRNSKIYINDYSGTSENGLKLFKDFYNLSVIDNDTIEKNPETGLISKGTFKDHKPLNNNTATGTNIYDGKTYTSGIKGGTNLDFFLRTDLSLPSDSLPWTPIASGLSDPCFNGTLHGDGHTISGLDNSLFGKLCGNVYNLGVTGSFTSAGVADTGDGYVESCWVKTTGTTPMVNKPYAVFGHPSDNSGYQTVNSYFCADDSCLYDITTSDGMTTSGGARGVATAKSARAFYNGEVAYDLNNFYLYKRYSDASAVGDTPVEYKYWQTGKLEPQTGKYPSYPDSHPDLCSSGFNSIKYVEERFADGDFRYAAGEIPTSEDERYYEERAINPETGEETVVSSSFYPIWPDDYIFFGQKLTYGWDATYAHQDVPTAVVRDGGRLSQTENANRVYRAPAYYRSKNMGVVHFNPQAYLAAKSFDGTQTVYPNMTAIDFAGHNDTTRGLGSVADGFPTGSPAFYPPLLDDDGLTGIRNCDETQNLLAYAPAASAVGSYANAKTNAVLTSYFTEPEYEDYYDNTQGYRIVTEAPTASVHGHLVQSDFSASNDHLLVDKQDFNAPLAFTFDSDHRMWYQRIPANQEFVDRSAGWQGISLPFEAELVTTDEKGEITHFYSGSETSKNGFDTKIGHEYWLREFSDIKEIKEEGEPAIAKADFRYPNAKGLSKTVSNTFLWDYYYNNDSGHDQLDKNADTYLEFRQYYKTERTYAAYPLIAAATPYIMGLPGQTYYEFDLSGKFVAQTTATPNPDKLGKQIITFASNTAEHIGVSDDEMTGKKVTYNSKDYFFKPSYMNETLDGTKVTAYVLDTAGDSFDKVADDATASVSAFRPYFLAKASGSPMMPMPKRITFGGTNGEEFQQGPLSALDGTIEIYARGHNIVTTSHMPEPTTISIVNISGVTLANFVLQPGETIETPVSLAGVYIVNKKKLFIH